MYRAKRRGHTRGRTFLSPSGLEVWRVLLASDHWSEALGAESTERPHGLAVATIGYGVCRRSSAGVRATLVVDDVGAGVDGLTVGGDEVGRWPRVVGGECRVRGSVLELEWFGWRAVEGVCRQWATT